MLSTKNKSVHNNYFITMPFLVHYDNGFFFSWNSNVEGRWEKANLELFFFLGSVLLFTANVKLTARVF